MARFLARRGYAVTYTTTDGSTGAATRRGLYDAVLVDLPEAPTRPPWDWAAIAEGLDVPAVVLEPATAGPADDAGEPAPAAARLRKPVLGDAVARALLEALAGRACGAPAAPAAPEPQGRPLSPRELQVLRLVAQGLPNRAVAEALGLREPTVKKHLQRLLGKLGARDRTQAAVMAVRRGLLR